MALREVWNLYVQCVVLTHEVCKVDLCYQRANKAQVHHRDNGNAAYVSHTKRSQSLWTPNVSDVELH